MLVCHKSPGWASQPVITTHLRVVIYTLTWVEVWSEGKICISSWSCLDSAVCGQKGSVVQIISAERVKRNRTDEDESAERKRERATESEKCMR